MKKMDVNVKILIMLEIIILIVCLASIFLVLAFTLGSPDEPMRLFVITKVMTCQWQTPVRMRVAGAENYVEQSQPFEEIKPIKCKGDDWDIVLSMMDQKQGYHFTAFNVTKLVASIK